MVSDAKINLEEEKAEDLVDSALDVVDAEPRLAAEQLREAAMIYFELGKQVDEIAVKKRFMKKGGRLKRRADAVSDTDTEPSAGLDDGEDVVDTDPSGTHRHRQRQQTRFFDEPPAKDLSDVGGLNEVKDALQANVQQPLVQPEFYRKQGVGIQNGILFYGPPGTGKSHLAECFAGELGYAYADVSASEIVSKYVGEAAQNVNQLFEDARSTEPCVIFLDELDALASERGGAMSETRSERQVVNELLQQMQQIQGSQIVVIAATNTKEDLDEAVVRSQRFNQTFHIGLPDAKARLQILKVQLDEDGRAIDWNGIDWKQLVKWSQGFSAADLADVVDDAVRHSADESTEEGELVPVQHRHLLQAMKAQQPSTDPDRRTDNSD
jgi:transitional endoplasmic reticulum ATPase